MGEPDADQPFIRDGINLRTLARRQRQIIWLIGVSLLLFLMEMPLSGFLRAFRWSSTVASIVGGTFWLLQLLVVVRTAFLARTLGMKWYWLPLLVIIMIMPLINLIFLLMENNAATALLKRNGLDVGFWGVSDEVVVQQLSADSCSKCGYNLTGNVSGVCPECGQVIHRAAPRGAS